MIDAAATILSEELGGDVTYDYVVKKLTERTDTHWSLIAKSVENPRTTRYLPAQARKSLATLFSMSLTPSGTTLRESLPRR